MNPRPASRKLRNHRHSTAGSWYAITTNCLDRAPLFVHGQSAYAVVQELANSNRTDYIETRAFVLMPDHLHWLFRLGEQRGIARVLQLFKGRSARRLNSVLGSRGTIWQDGYYERQVRTDRELSDLGTYLLHNPVRAGLVRRWQDYPWLDLNWQRFGYLLGDEAYRD